VLRLRALEKPAATAFVFQGDEGELRVTYAELDERARSIADVILAAGAGGARVMLVYPPGLDYVAALFGCFYAGAAAVPTYPPDPARLGRTLPRLLAIVRDARPHVVLTTDAVRAALDELLFAEIEGAEVSSIATDSLPPGDEGLRRPPEVALEELALLQYTSGSTAAPRGVMLTHANLLDNSEFIRRAFGHSAGSRGAIWLPPYHDMGLIGGVLQPIYAGFPCVLMSPLTFLRRPLSWLRAISDHRGTTSGGPNFAFDLCVRHIDADRRAELDLSSWEVAFNGSETVRRETIDAFSEAFRDSGFRREAFFPCYGLAESTLMVTGGERLSGPQGRRHEGKDLVGCGRPDRGHRVVIADPASRTRFPEGREGEIWVSGPSVAAGYWERRRESEAAFGATLAEHGAGPFLRTGDLGLLLDGELYVTGRIKEVVIVGGRNHHPLDIELACEQAVPQLRRGCGAAFSFDPDGREQLAIVYEVAGDQSVDYEAVIRSVRQAVARAVDAQVHAIVLIRPHSIPKTSSGKVQRRLCRSLLVERKLHVVAEWSLLAR
jgi:acyl-CoA synthetase (AMP-forming)/AMP-acid ligase II